MRKFLLTSTALVGAFAMVDRADAQQLTTDSPFTVRIDGFANFRGGIVGDSNQTGVPAVASNAIRRGSPNINGHSSNFRTDTEVHVTATGKADNGLVYGMYVEIEADPALNTLTTSTVNGATGTATGVGTSGQNYIDEANIFLQGTWGRIEMGDQDGAGDQLFFGAPFDYGPAYGQGSGADGDILFRWSNTAFVVNNASSNINATPLYSWNVRALDSSDATKFTYLSPVIAGFRAGVSYVPNGGQNGFLPANGPGGRSNISLTSLTTAGIAAQNPATGALAALPATGTGGLAANKGTYADYADWFEIGGQWRGTFGDVGLGVMAAYTHATHKSSVFQPVAAANTTAASTLGTFGTVSFGPYNYVDINSFDVGGQVSWMGFTVGGSYANHGRSTYLTGPGLLRGNDAWDTAAGIQYAIGPWVVGYNYSYSYDAGSLSPTNNRANGGGGDFIEWHSIGAKYILAPGLFMFTEFAHYQIHINGANVDFGNAGIVGTGIRF